MRCTAFSSAPVVGAGLLTNLLRSGTLGPESSVAKLMWAHWHQAMGELWMRLEGNTSDLVGHDYRLSKPQQVFLDARAETIYGGSSEVQRNIVGERALGLAK